MIYLKIYAVIFGLLVGSFLNVVIYRLPRDLSIVFPRSNCPNCKTLIPWYFNIPVISYLFLRGKCGYCKANISLRYPLIELATGIVSLLLFPNYLTSETIMLYFFFFSVFCSFLCHFFIDLEFKILPDSINLYLFFLFVTYSLLFQDWMSSLLGGIVGFFVPLIVAWLFYKMRGVVGLGGGDIKLYGILGIYLGIEGIINNIFLSCLLGSLISGLLILTKKMSKDTPIAFGPFILIAASIQLYFPQVIDKIFH